MVVEALRHVQAAHFQDTGHRPGWWRTAARWSMRQQTHQAEQAATTHSQARERDRRAQGYNLLIITCTACGTARLAGPGRGRLGGTAGAGV